MKPGQAVRLPAWAAVCLLTDLPVRSSGKYAACSGASSTRQSLVRLATLPRDRYSRVVECAAPLATCDNPEFHHQIGVELFIAGVEAIAARLSDGSAVG